MYTCLHMPVIRTEAMLKCHCALVRIINNDHNIHKHIHSH